MVATDTTPIDMLASAPRGRAGPPGSPATDRRGAACGDLTGPPSRLRGCSVAARRAAVRVRRALHGPVGPRIAVLAQGELHRAVPPVLPGLDVRHPGRQRVQALAAGADDQLADPVVGVDLSVRRLRGEARVEVLVPV